MNSIQLTPVEGLMTFALTLSPATLLTFLCEDCGGAFGPDHSGYAQTGCCTRCHRCKEVTNPVISRYLHQAQISLAAPAAWNPNAEAVLLRYWLIPYDYAEHREVHVNEGISTRDSWVRYGQRKQMQLDHSRLSSPVKRKLRAFYSCLYTPVRFDGSVQERRSDAHRTPIAWLRDTFASSWKGK